MKSNINSESNIIKLHIAYEKSNLSYITFTWKVINIT